MLIEVTALEEESRQEGGVAVIIVKQIEQNLDPAQARAHPAQAALIVKSTRA